MSFPCVTLDAGALRGNLAVVRRLAPASGVMAVVKANAYGHGLIPAARALANADAFGVARLNEGLALRAAGVRNPIVLLEGVLAAEELQAAAAEHLELVVHSDWQIELLERMGEARGLRVWLKIDTGMNRLGFRTEDSAAALGRLRRCTCIGEMRVMTHLAGAEERDSASTRRQIAAFHAFADSLRLERSIANSAGLIIWPDARVEWVRPGLMLYGISPLPDVDAATLGLQPVMTLTTQLIATRRVRAGETVGYNGIWRAPRDTRIGIAAIGYGDGYPRNVRSGVPVLVGAKPSTVVGRVSMDMTAVDLSDLPDARVGDIVTLWGMGLPVERIAPFAETIAYELVCGINQRVTAQWR